MNVRELPATYAADYNRGWRASQRSSDGALDRADGRGERDAWYDGYLDFATGREKWHLRDCASHPNCEPEETRCGAANPNSRNGKTCTREPGHPGFHATAATCWKDEER